MVVNHWRSGGDARAASLSVPGRLPRNLGAAAARLTATLERAC